MPVSIGQARDILRRQSGGEAPELLAHRLASVSPEERPIPPSVPKPLACVKPHGTCIAKTQPTSGGML